MNQNTSQGGKRWLIQLCLLGTLLFSLVVLGYFANRSIFWTIGIPFLIGGLAYYMIAINGQYRLRSPGAILLTGLVLRLVFLPAEPRLTEDHYRFFWDAKVSLSESSKGVYGSTPGELMSDGSKVAIENRDLYCVLNSPDYPTIYPPLAQVFFVSATITGKSYFGTLISFRVFLILSELILVFVLLRLFRKFKIEPSGIAVWVFNPLVIVEFTGNLHFDGLMILFLVASIGFHLEKKWIPAAILLSFSVGIKWLTLIYFPLLLTVAGWRKTMWSGLIACGTIAILFVPFIRRNDMNYLLDSFGLFLQKFEFNASIHYLTSAVGKNLVGFNPLYYSGIFFFCLVCCILAFFAMRKPKDSNGINYFIAAGGTVYFLLLLFSSVVHPWYVVLLLIPAMFLDWKFPIVWSLLIPLSYIFYDGEIHFLYPVFVGLEYLVVLIFVWRERIKIAQDLFIFSKGKRSLESIS